MTQLCNTVRKASQAYPHHMILECPQLLRFQSWVQRIRLYNFMWEKFHSQQKGQQKNNHRWRVFWKKKEEIFLGSGDGCVLDISKTLLPLKATFSNVTAAKSLAEHFVLLTDLHVKAYANSLMLFTLESLTLSCSTFVSLLSQFYPTFNSRCN